MSFAPGKIVCVGRNYVEHAKELGHDVPSEPIIFLKPASSVIAHGDAIVRPTHMSALVHHEAELAVVIDRKMHRVKNPLDFVRGYTCANDVTARDLQKKDVQFTRAKSFDTFCPLGPKVVMLDDPQNVDIELTVNGEVRQRGNTRDMVFSIAHLLSFISDVMTLDPGDVVLTGTPAGVGPLVHGDVVNVTIAGIGTLSNPVLNGE
jgi:2-keto-4-pentenoate hydratase/2-oxohepta-3-ene-1,7-dioic acid hydratase in catechol pathway